VCGHPDSGRRRHRAMKKVETTVVQNFMDECMEKTQRGAQKSEAMRDLQGLKRPGVVLKPLSENSFLKSCFWSPIFQITIRERR